MIQVDYIHFKTKIRKNMEFGNDSKLSITEELGSVFICY